MRKTATEGWCPGGGRPCAARTRKHVRCPECGRRLLAAENPCCGSDAPDPYRKRSRLGNTCNPSPFRIPPHKASDAAAAGRRSVERAVRRAGCRRCGAGCPAACSCACHKGPPAPPASKGMALAKAFLGKGKMR